MKSWKREAEIWKVWLILCKFNIRQVYNRRISNSKISNALVGVDRKDLMRKLSKFIYEEEKALEFGHHLLSAKRRRTQQIARLTPMMPNEAELMSFGKILENNMTVGQCKLPLVGLVEELS
ncbi:uncharacterized protein [Malus domestica]|uniref:uncharacterized protein isoform X2 n=1 Tax=Malus domestica TaxID=3750 RepID=UPI0039761F93